MKRTLFSLLSVLCLLAGLTAPIFASDAPSQEPAQSIASESAPAETEPMTDDELPSVETEAPQPESEHSEESASQQEQQDMETRAPDAMTTSTMGISFIENFTGKNPKDTEQLKAAENAVNEFIRGNRLSLNQTQFDALVSFVMEKGTNMLRSGYRCEKVIASGSYTDAELAEAFCAWVKDGAGYFSEQILARRLRQIKLFLYASYDGICDAQFRYVVYDANGGKLNDNTVLCYTLNATFSNLPDATRSGYYFAGWYTSGSDGIHLCNGYKVTGNYRVQARWSKTEVAAPNEPTSGESQTDPGTDIGTTPDSQSGAGVTTYPEHPEWPQLPSLKISEAGIRFIKEHEGFAANPMWDYGQYSVGYGSRYDASTPIKISSPITTDEADYLLRYYLGSFEKRIDKILEKGTVTHTQAQYDAIVSLTYNLGEQWVNSQYNIYEYILFGGCTETDFVNTLGSWCRAGGSVLAGLCMRRMEEADLYWNGDYVLRNSQYRCLVFNAAGGSCPDPVEYYRAGNALGKLPVPTKDGHVFVGWFDKTKGGTQYTAQSTPPSSYVTYLYAHWEVGEATPPDPPVEGFTDVHPTDWFYSWVNQAVDAQLFRGISEKEFAPNSEMTRAMLVTVLYRMAGSPSVHATSKFTDVDANAWYADAVIWASENGIVNGMSETEFAPNGILLREQLAAMLLRYAPAFPKLDPDQRADLGSFSDSGSVSPYAVSAMQWCVKMGIINGMDGKLEPSGSATRAQCAKMLVCFSELCKK